MRNHKAGGLPAVVVLGLLSLTGAGCATVGKGIGEGIAAYLDTKQTPSSAIESKGDSGTPAHPARTHRR